MNKKIVLISSAVILSTVLGACGSKQQTTETTSTTKEVQTVVTAKKEKVSTEKKQADITKAIANFNDAKSLKIAYKDGLNEWAYSGTISNDIANNKFIVIEQNKQGKLSVYYDRKNDEFFTLIDRKDVSDDYSQSIPLVQLADRRVEAIMNFFKVLSEHQNGDLTFELTKSGEYEFTGKKSALATAVKATSTDNGQDNVKNIDGKDLNLLLTVNQQNEISAIKITGNLLINFKDGSSEEAPLNTEYMITNYNKTGVKFEKATKDKANNSMPNEQTSENTLEEHGHHH